MEDVVYHGINDYLNYLVSGFSHFRNPARPFTTNDLVMYSRGVWGKYVERTFGRGAMKRTWEFIRQFRPLQAIDATFHEYGSSFPLAYSEWARWNFYTGHRADTGRSYQEGAIFPEIVQSPRDFAPPSTALVGTLEPFGSRYHQVFVPHPGAAGDTLTVLISNINLASAEAGTAVPEDYECILADSKIDASYRQAESGLFAKFTTANPSTWDIWFLLGSNASQPFGVNALAEGTAFPNPFYADGRARVSIPIDGRSPVTGSLQIYSSGMDLVYLSHGDPTTVGSRQVFSWNGATNSGRIAASGVYVFVLSLSDDRTVTGKIALLRK
jgi:hypothetical protein